MRRNTFRRVDGLPDLQGTTSAFYEEAFINMILEENIVDLSVATPVSFGSGTVNSTTSFFANQDSSGKLVQGWDTTRSANVTEVSTVVDDASALAII